MNRLACEMQIWSDVQRREPAAWLALDDDYLHCPAGRREIPVCRTQLLGISEPAVPVEFKSKPELICDTRT